MKAGLCKFGHTAKAFNKMEKGWYVRTPSKGGESIRLEPMVKYEVGMASNRFMGAKDSTLTDDLWFALFEAVNDGTLESAPEDEFEDFVRHVEVSGAQDYLGELPATTPFK